MSNATFEQFMTRLVLREHTYAVYDRDVCLGDVCAVNATDAENQARSKFGFKSNAPVFVERIS